MPPKSKPRQRQRDAAYIDDIIDACRRIAVYLEDSSFEDFKEDAVLQDAVLRRLGIIGEAAASLSSSFKMKHPLFKGLPWKDVVDFRNVLIHQYFAVNLRIVWDTLENAVPEMLEYLVHVRARM